MPTGYTYEIENGEINTGAEFLKLCTRAFCIAADMRDESLSVPTPSYFEPDPRYYEAYQKAVKRRDEYRNITFYCKNEVILWVRISIYLQRIQKLHTDISEMSLSL